MSDHSTYDALRHFADSWGLLALGISFIVLIAWPFRPGAEDTHRDIANKIFDEDEANG